VAQLIAQHKPFAVLIEGPSDFNDRLEELRLDHTLPVALYSYANEEGSAAAQCWFPFLDYSPEWVAQRLGQDAGALVRFIDLPHWQYRAIPDAHKAQHDPLAARPAQQRQRYGQVVQALCERFGCDGDNALWDHLFESLPADAPADDLHQRLDLYFNELRGDDPGTEQDIAREQTMASWVAWAQASAVAEGQDGLVLVVCGGWHKLAIDTLWPTLDGRSEPLNPAPASDRAAGSYLVPYEFRQVDALGGYRSGMQSPLFYQWAWAHGLAEAGTRAMAQIVSRLRRRKLPLSTADLFAFEQTLGALSRLRGHATPLRHDILDALQSTVVKEALDRPPPWVNQFSIGTNDHPALREALLVLTGDGVGRLHANTPLPPLLHDVTRRLADCGLQVQRTPQTLVLDRRIEADNRRAHALWQLKVIGVRGATLKETRAPHASRQLRAELRFEEHWALLQDDSWYPNLIEAAVHGATLEGAARQALLTQVEGADGDPAASTECLLHALRAGLTDMGEAMAQALQHTLPHSHDHAALARAAHLLFDIGHAGFWGTATQALLNQTQLLLAERILWLLETHTGRTPDQLTGDVDAVRVFDVLLRQHPSTDTLFIRETLLRFARGSERPPGVRGAALGVACMHEALGPDATAQIVAITRAVPPRDELGDFLYGLFACARSQATSSDLIVQAVHAALEEMSTADFLVALPQLRNAFGWFPPKERGVLAGMLAELLGLSTSEQSRLLNLRQGTGTLLDAKRIEAQALAWAAEWGLPT
jgi:hypothetical protein